MGDYLNSPLKAYCLPGHCDGEYGLAPDNKKWFFIGDIIESHNTVMVQNLTHYYQSLRFIIDFEPAVILPSHGFAMGSSKKLSAVLSYRKARENQIRKLYTNGLDKEAIYETLYAHVPNRIKQLALITIQSYLDYFKDHSN